LVGHSDHLSRHDANCRRREKNFNEERLRLREKRCRFSISMLAHEEHRLLRPGNAKISR
jgi:hypothetical protein